MRIRRRIMLDSVLELGIIIGFALAMLALIAPHVWTVVE